MLLFVISSLGVANNSKIKSTAMTNPATVSINPELCDGCGQCILQDPYEILSFTPEGKAGFFGNSGGYTLADEDELATYQDLAGVCPYNAFTFK